MSTLFMPSTEISLQRAREVVQAAVDAANLRAVAEEIGVSHATVANFLDDTKTPAEKTVRLVARWIDNVDAGGDVLEEDYLQRKIDEIDASGLDEHAKMLKVEVLAAAIRADAARIEARAAAIRARAIERAEMSAEGRARAIERESESATARTVALQEKRTEPAPAPQYPLATPHALEEEDRILANIRELEERLSRSRGSQRGAG